jgi:hypothetical protein
MLAPSWTPLHVDQFMDAYQIRTAYLAPQHVLSITADEYSAHVMARRCLIDAGNFERRYEMLLGNFLAWEEFCAVSRLRFDLVRDFSYEQGDILIMEANRHITNVFASGKAYVDQVKRDFKFQGEEDDFSNQAVALIRAAYGRSLAYRLTYELRNRSQHRAFLVDGFDAGDSTGGPGDVAFYCFISKIVEDPGEFKKSVLDEAPDKILLHQTLRGYMTDVSGIHIALRAKARPEVDRSRALFTTSIAAYAAAQSNLKEVSKDGIGIDAVHLRDDTIVEAVPLLLKWDNTRKRLSEQNRYPIT